MSARPTLLNTSALSGSTPAGSASALGSTPLTPQSQFDRRRNAIDNGRNLVICFDGTANEFTDANTNIVKLFTFLEKVRQLEREITRCLLWVSYRRSRPNSSATIK